MQDQAKVKNFRSLQVWLRDMSGHGETNQNLTQMPITFYTMAQIQ